MFQPKHRVLAHTTDFPAVVENDSPAPTGVACQEDTGVACQEDEWDLFKWARTHPSLQHVEVHQEDGGDVPGYIMRNSLALKAAQPQLEVTCNDGQYFYGLFGVV